jgi:hypothetical protein
MNLSTRAFSHVWLLVVLGMTTPAAADQARETFSATAVLKTAGGGTATAPVTVTVDRKMSQKEAETLAATFKAGGAAGLRKALADVPPTGSVALGGRPALPTRLTFERATDKGRLLTIVTDRPILWAGGGLPDAKPKDGYDFAVLDIEVDATGSGSGTLAPAARIAVSKGAFVVEDYGSSPMQLTAVKAIK